MMQQWLARVALKAGDRVTALKAWSAARALDKDYMAEEHDAHIALLEAASAGAPRIALIGNCQVYPLARFLRQLTGAQVVSITPRDFVDPVLAALVLEEVREFEFVVSQPVDRGWGALASDRLRKQRPDLIALPSLVFTGFQPDLLPISAERWPGPMPTFREFHSLLGMAAYLKGFSAQRAAELFNSYVFAKIGYFDEYEAGVRYLVDEARAMGFDIADDMAEWQRYGVFFHTHNHPAVPVLWSLTRKLAARMGLPIDDKVVPPDSYFREDVWPLYPDLARRLGLVGSFTFRPPSEAPIDLGDLLARDFKAYAATDLRKVELHRAWEVAGVLDSIGAKP